MIGFSLFEESKYIHKHVECTEDFYRELCELFKIARKWYFMAVKNHMKTEDFIEFFERSHHHVDCDNAKCKNSRLLMLGIIGKVFRDKHSMANIEAKEDFSQQEIIDLFLRHVSVVLPLSNQKESTMLTLGCKPSERQMDMLVELVQNHNIFELPDGHDMRSVLLRLLLCDPEVFIYVKNVRNAAILFDAMAQCHLINNNWQHIMTKGNFLRKSSKEGTDKCITSSCLSSSLSRVRKGSSMTASQYAICKTIEQMLREE